MAQQARVKTGKDPDAVVITHAGGGNVTGTARGLKKAGCTGTKVIGASVDLRGLHMASDHDFNTILNGRNPARGRGDPEVLG